MKLKKIAKVLLSCVMAGALFTGCGGGNEPAQKTDGDKPAAGSSAQIKLGMITHLNATEKKMDEILQMVQEDSGVNVAKYAVTYYDNLNIMEMGLESGGIDQMSLYKSVADYVVASNEKFEIVSKDITLNTLSDNFCFAVRKNDTQLKNELDKIIGEMKSDGSLEKLVKEYIADVDKGKAPPAIEIPMTEGADTIKVGVTGDLPPLDYVSTDGKAAGFNTALLAEIAKRSGKNIEVVQIESGARAAALNSNQIDIIFWAVTPNADKRPADIDKPEGVEFSESYFKDNVAHLQLKK